MSRVTYECDNGTRFIFLADSAGNEVVDILVSNYYIRRYSIDELVKILRIEKRVRHQQVRGNRG